MIIIYKNLFFLDIELPNLQRNNRIAIKLRGAFVNDRVNASNTLSVYIQILNDHQNGTQEMITNVQRISLRNETDLSSSSEVDRDLVFNIDHSYTNATLQVHLLTNLNVELPLKFTYDPTPVDTKLGVILAAVVLLGLYVMIIWDIVHRTFAAMLASTMAIAILAAMGERPSMHLIMSWIDVETLLLLFGMMILVAVLSETGVFDYFAVYAYKVNIYSNNCLKT